MRYVQGYQKCDLEVCTGLSEMLHEASVQGSQKCDMRHVHSVIRNVMSHFHRVISNVT